MIFKTKSEKSQRDGISQRRALALRTPSAQSRRDDILLTAGFNLWIRNAICFPQSPEGTTYHNAGLQPCGADRTTLWYDNIQSRRDCIEGVRCLVHRAKALRWDIPSLWDFDAIIYYF